MYFGPFFHAPCYEEEFDVKVMFPQEITDEALKAVDADAAILNPGGSDFDEKQEEALTNSIDAFLNRMMDTEETKSLIQSSFKSLPQDLKKIQ